MRQQRVSANEKEMLQLESLSFTGARKVRVSGAGNCPGAAIDSRFVTDCRHTLLKTLSN